MPGSLFFRLFGLKTWQHPKVLPALIEIKVIGVMLRQPSKYLILDT
jgi:hypothetical protein